MLLVSAILNKGVTRALKNVYPLKHANTIADASIEFGVDVFLVAAVIKVESNYREAVVSRKGAVGLMQILPSTAGEAAMRVGLVDYTTEDLYKPDVNIRLGTWYLGHLLCMFEGDLDYALMAYNGGPRNVQQWHDGGQIEPGGDLGAIPFRETREFVRKIKRTIPIYKKLYAKEFNGL